MSEATITVDQRNTIITLIRRGEPVAKISRLLHINRDAVERIFEWYVSRGMQ